MASPHSKTTGVTQMDAEERPRKVRRTLGDGPSGLGQVVTIVVGSGETQDSFVLHEVALRQSSAFFDNALKVGWKEAKDRTIKLPETSPTDFAIYSKFVLTGLIFTHSEEAMSKLKDKELEIAMKRGHRKAILSAIFELFKLASFLQSPDFQDAVLDSLIETMHEIRSTVLGGRIYFAEDRIETIYNGSAPDSPLRKYFVDASLHAWIVNTSFKKDDFTVYPTQFCHDLLQKALPYALSQTSLGGMKDPADLTKSCKYHEHTKRGEPCYKEKFQYSTDKTAVVKEQKPPGSAASPSG